MTTGTTDTQEVQQKAQETAATLVEQAQQVAQANVATQKDRAAETIGAVAQALRQSGEGMRDQQPQIAALADQAAQRVEGISTFVRDREVGDMIGEAERFARREPLMFLGGAFAVGFLAARFLKATSPQSSGRNSGYTGSYSSSYYGSGYGASTGGGTSNDYAESAGYGESGNAGASGINGALGTASAGWSGSELGSNAGETAYIDAAVASPDEYGTDGMAADGGSYNSSYAGDPYTGATQELDRVDADG